jgi:hypothetical protein
VYENKRQSLREGFWLCFPAATLRSILHGRVFALPSIVGGRVALKPGPYTIGLPDENEVLTWELKLPPPKEHGLSWEL